MRKQTIRFFDQSSLCVFPENRGQLPQAMAELGLASSYQVIVLIGGFIPDTNATVTQKTIETIAAFAEENNILIICGGSRMGIMASIGQTRQAHGNRFPLLGVNLESKVTWPNMPWYVRFLGWGRERWPLADGYSHFLLVPGNQYGEDSPWIAEAAACLSERSSSVTILVNGGGVARKDIDLSLEYDRPVITLAGTGRLADELAEQPNRSSLITTVQAEDDSGLKKNFSSCFISLVRGRLNVMHSRKVFSW